MLGEIINFRVWNTLRVYEYNEDILWEYIIYNDLMTFSLLCIKQSGGTTPRQWKSWVSRDGWSQLLTTWYGN